VKTGYSQSTNFYFLSDKIVLEAQEIKILQKNTHRAMDRTKNVVDVTLLSDYTYTLLSKTRNCRW